MTVGQPEPIGARLRSVHSPVYWRIARRFGGSLRTVPLPGPGVHQSEQLR